MFRGHAGLSLLLFSPFMFLFRGFGVDTNLIVVGGFFIVVVSFVPDLDLFVRRYGLKMRHRGITHTLLFGVVVGILLSITLALVYGSYGWLMGFVVGFLGTASHLLGDVFTCGLPKVKPFYPFSDRELAHGLFTASDKTVNNAMLVLGAIAFTISYMVLGSL